MRVFCMSTGHGVGCGMLYVETGVAWAAHTTSMVEHLEAYLPQAR